MRRSAPVISVALLAWILLPAPAPAACADYGGYAHWEGSGETSRLPLDVAVQGYAYVLTWDHHLEVFDISTPGSPEQCGGSSTIGLPYKVALSGTHAYVAEGGTLEVFDISEAPHVEAQGSVNAPAWGLAVSGDRVYTVGDVTLAVIDVADPEQPRIMATVGVPGPASGVAVSGVYAYVATGSWLVVIDISRTVPAIVGSVAKPGAGGNVAVVGGYAFVADGNFEVFDISDPRDPRMVGQLDCSNSLDWDLEVSGSAAFATAYQASQVNAIDISDPLNPQLLSSMTTSCMATGVAADAGYVYVTDCTDSYYVGYLDVFNFQNPETIPLLSTLDTMGYVWDVATAGDYAYMTGDTAPYQEHGVFQVIDIANPRDPALLADVDIQERGCGVAVSDGFVFVAGWLSGGVLLVFDVTDPQAPELVGRATMPVAATDVAISGTYAYVTSGSAGLHVFDVTDPRAPQFMGSVDTPGAAARVGVLGSFAYVADSDSGLQVIDVTDPANPWIVAGVPVSDAKSVAVADGHVYVGSEDGYAVVVIDVSDPLFPFVTAGIRTSGTVHGLAVSDQLLYVASYCVCVVDVADPWNPRTVGQAWLRYAFGIAASEDVVLASGYVPSLSILPTQCVPAAVDELDGPASSARVCFEPSLAPGQTALRFALACSGQVRADVYDVAGRRVRRLHKGVLGAGVHVLPWDGRDESGRETAAGLYLARVSTSEGTKTGRIMIVR